VERSGCGCEVAVAKRWWCHGARPWLRWCACTQGIRCFGWLPWMISSPVRWQHGADRARCGLTSSFCECAGAYRWDPFLVSCMECSRLYGLFRNLGSCHFRFSRSRKSTRWVPHRFDLIPTPKACIQKHGGVASYRARHRSSSSSWQVCCFRLLLDVIVDKIVVQYQITKHIKFGNHAVLTPPGCRCDSALPRRDQPSKEKR
jgi:hypothetical protein